MKVSSEKGAAIVEFALVVPLLLLILFGIIEFGIMIYNQQVITNASREAARAGIVASTPRQEPDDIEGVASNYCNGRLITFGSPNTPVCLIEPIKPDGTPSGTPINTDDATFGDELKVSVSYNYSFLLMPAFMSDMIGGKTLMAKTVMKYE